MNLKIKTREELQGIVANLEAQGKKIVHTNGGYDIIHYGHLHTLTNAKNMGDILVVSINSDSSIKKFKGENRPILDENERAGLLAALECVDYVTVFSEDDILKSLEMLKPNFHVKGGTFILERIKQEKDLVESWGGELRTLPLIEGKSSTNIINRIIESQKNVKI